jgi:putative peptidoglycan lipid II flippase
LAGVFNAALLWRYLRRQGLYQPEPGWGRWVTRIMLGLVAMSAVVLAIRGWVGEWSALPTLWRWIWLLVAVTAGGVAYAGALLALGLRPRHLRH